MPSFLFWHMRGEERRACASYRFPSAMAAPGWCALWTLCVCFTALQTNALRVTMRESTMEVVRGDYVILPCSFFTSSPLSRLNIIWTLAPFSSPESPIQVIVYDHGQIIEDPSLIGRVGFTGLPWSADIMVNDTRVSDAGVYRCMVNNPPEAADPGIGELLLTVLVAPSLPACRWDGDMDTGGSVTLSCSVAEGIPTPEIRWDKLNPEEISLPINMEGELSGSVQIINVSAQTSGLYRCSASNLLGTENCYINLSIYSGEESSSGILQGVLLTLSMSLMLLALLVLMTWLHRTGQDGRWRVSKEEEEEEGYNEIRYTPSLMKRSFV
ncbi:immunoglobulin superfamily member 11 isoform X2 [Corythoichthys intestinalis]|uniref:immunoglobulin superfamily member 11 isoform X2 n=1 Tax=Corythoichthys intestinalis TaxID=161448 RepID=UPI0025A6186A|nr:immunoglobulin superfamily member 11 isoform X2 [Corythoichthys intestinalis]